MNEETYYMTTEERLVIKRVLDHLGFRDRDHVIQTAKRLGCKYPASFRQITIQPNE